MKYILTWVVVSIVSTTCPETSKLSEFGISSKTTCAVYHAKKEKIKYKKEFTNKDSLRIFTKKLKEYEIKNKAFLSEGINEIKIDSINN